MSEFKKAWLKTSKNEGGYVNNSVDRGKETYRGIAIAFHPDWEGWPIIHKAMKDIGIIDTLDAGRGAWKVIDNALAGNTILDAMVMEFYKKEYWDPLDLDNEPDQLIADEYFDTAVNMGVGAAKRMIQEVNKNA